MAARSRTRLSTPLLLVTLLPAALALPACQPSVDSAQPLAVRLGDRLFMLELAVTPRQRHQGLSDRPTMPADAGMLFVFPDSDQRAFVMRRCHFPIDLIYLSPKGRIVDMHTMHVEPPGTSDRDLTPYVSRWPAHFAIEIHGGLIGDLGLETGQVIDLPLAALKQLAR